MMIPPRLQHGAIMVKQLPVVEEEHLPMTLNSHAYCHVYLLFHVR